VQRVRRFTHALGARSAPWYVLLTGVPLLCLVVYIRRYAVDIPYWDQWSGELPLIVKSYAGTLTWQDLWAQHNEHRPLFARLIWIPLARLTGWQIGYELTVNVLFAVGTLGVLLYQFSATMAQLGYPRVNCVWPVISLLCFALSQWENWLQGFQILLFMNIFGVVAGLCVLGQPRLSPGSFVLAVILGVVATYTITNGLLYWGIGLGMLLLQHRHARPLYWWSWSGMSMLVVGVYFYDYQRPPGHPPLQVAFEQPLDYAAYVLMFLGAPLQRDRYALIPGLFGLMLLLWLVWQLHRHKQLMRFLPYVGVTLYSVGSAVLIGLGRVGFGWQQALSSRYVTIASLLWVVVVMVLYWEWQQARDTAWQQQQHHMSIAICMAGIAGMVVLGSVRSIRPSVEWQYEPLLRARQALIAGNADDGVLARLYADPQYVREQVKHLQRYRLSIYRDLGD